MSETWRVLGLSAGSSPDSTMMRYSPRSTSPQPQKPRTIPPPNRIDGPPCPPILTPENTPARPARGCRLHQSKPFYHPHPPPFNPANPSLTPPTPRHPAYSQPFQSKPDQRSMIRVRSASADQLRPQHPHLASLPVLTPRILRTAPSPHGLPRRPPVGRSVRSAARRPNATSTSRQTNRPTSESTNQRAGSTPRSAGCSPH